jgi:hypothetical protein
MSDEPPCDTLTLRLFRSTEPRLQSAPWGWTVAVTNRATGDLDLYHGPHGWKTRREALDEALAFLRERE